MDKLDAAWFKADLGEDVIIALAKVAATSQQDASGGGGGGGGGVKRYLTPEPPLAPKVARGEEGSKRQEKRKAVDAKEKELVQQIRTCSPSQVVSWIDSQFANAEVRQAMATLMSKVCKNCISGGRGLQRHTRAQCEAAGNRRLSLVPFALGPGTSIIIGVHNASGSDWCSLLSCVR
jgi:hypothetical protein